MEVRLYFIIHFSKNLFDIGFSYKGCNFTPVVKAECRFIIGKLFCMSNAKKMIIVQLNSSLHIAQVRIFLWQRTILVNVPTFGRSENYDGGKFMPAT